MKRNWLGLRENERPILEQPVDMLLRQSRRVLLAGCGGGYDVLGAVPLWAELAGRGIEVSLASLSFCCLNALDGASVDPEVSNLYAVDGRAATPRTYCPEAWLARWIEETAGRPQTIWCFEKTGVVPLRRAYRRLLDRLGFDTVILIDGGI